MRVYWNDDWHFSEGFTQTMVTGESHLTHEFKPVRLPHSVVETPFNYFSEHIYQKVSCYKKIFNAPSQWQGKAVLLTFEGVAHEAMVYVNGQHAITHQGGYAAFTVDISPFLNFNTQNMLVVKVDSRESLNIPPFGYVVDYMTYGGIYRDVYIEVKEPCHMSDVFVYSKEILTPKRSMVVAVTLSKAKQDESLRVRTVLFDADDREVLWDEQALSTLTPDSRGTYTFELPLPEVKLWDLEMPYLYRCRVELSAASSKDITSSLLDTYDIKVGFREAVFEADGFKLNGKPLKIRGLNRHQSYPYVGYAMPKRPQQLDAQVMKVELGVNAVRTSHYPQSKDFIEACDALGLLVFTELPGWQHIGDEAWQTVAVQMVTEMVTQYRNHPSIVLWGVRINESKDDDAFYQKTNQMARTLDPSRQTGGVRCIKNSHLLEDVYTYNDFSHNGKTKGIDRKKAVTPEKDKGYLVTEYNGHMFPTKPFDSEAHRTEHALRHATVLDAIAGDDEVAGGFGWCLFDYNTHQDFGSGDRICYHGVLDMFRNPKTAAAVYSSQSDIRPVLKLSSDMAIGDFPEGGIGNVYAFSNADQIKLYKNDAYVKTFLPNQARYPHLPHAPFIIDDFIGELMEKHEGFSHQMSEDIKSVLMAVSNYGQTNLPLKFKLKVIKLMLFNGMTFQKAEKLFYDYVGNWGGKATEYRLDAIQNGEVVKSIYKKPMQSFKLQITVDETQLKESKSYDVSTIRIMAVNELDEHLAYFQDVVTFETEGAIDLIGPKQVAMMGGGCGTYVKTTGVAGKGRLTIKCRDIIETIEYNIEL